jgi:hypothetical protein
LRPAKAQATAASRPARAMSQHPSIRVTQTRQALTQRRADESGPGLAFGRRGAIGACKQRFLDRDVDAHRPCRRCEGNERDRPFGVLANVGSRRNSSSERLRGSGRPSCAMPPAMRGEHLGYLDDDPIGTVRDRATSGKVGKRRAMTNELISDSEVSFHTSDLCQNRVIGALGHWPETRDHGRRTAAHSRH